MPLWFALVLLGLVALALGSFRSAAATAALLANWLFLDIYFKLTGDTYNPLVNGAVDLATGIFILAIPFSRTQTFLAATFIFGLGWHGWYVQSLHDAWAQYHYWYGMHDMAWSQLWIAVGWTGLEVYGLAERGCYPWRAVLVRPRLHRQVVTRNRAGEEA